MKKPTMKVWIEAWENIPDYVLIHATEPTRYDSKAREWVGDDGGQDGVDACRDYAELVFGKLPPSGSKTLVEFNLRTGKRVEWEPVEDAP